MISGSLEQVEEDPLLAHWLFHSCLFVLGHCLFAPKERNTSFFEPRLSWDECANKHTRRGTLRVRLRMERDSFDVLVETIRADLVVNELMAKPRGGISSNRRGDTG